MKNLLYILIFTITYSLSTTAIATILIDQETTTLSILCKLAQYKELQDLQDPQGKAPETSDEYDSMHEQIEEALATLLSTADTEIEIEQETFSKNIDNDLDKIIPNDISFFELPLFQHILTYLHSLNKTDIIRLNNPS